LLKSEQVHGVLNAVSWGILMPLGAIIARYMRVFKSADPAWFYLHVTCQFSAYVIGVAGWGTGLKLGSQSPGIVYHSHRNIGIALFCFATLQVCYTSSCSTTILFGAYCKFRPCLTLLFRTIYSLGSTAISLF